MAGENSKLIIQNSKLKIPNLGTNVVHIYVHIKKQQNRTSFDILTIS